MLLITVVESRPFSYIVTHITRKDIMRIVWLCPYPVSQLGAQLEWGSRGISSHPCSWIKNLSTALRRMPEVELHLITLSSWVAYTQTVEHDGLQIHVVKNGIPFIHRGYRPNFRFDVLTDFFFETKSVRRELDTIRPDLIHAHGTENEYALIAMRSGYPWLTSIQGIVSEFKKTDSSRYFDLMEPLEELAVRTCRYFTCRTHFDTGFVRQLNPDAKIFDIPEAMNPVFWEGQWADPADNRILFVGGGASRKGLHELMDAVSVVAKDVPDVSVDVVGICTVEQQKIFGEAAQAAGFKIRFHGFRNASEIATLHRQCRLFVLCSSNENSPNTLAEAMVSGMPCVAYNVGGVSSMFEDGKSGLLIKPHDVAALASGVAGLLVDKEKAKAMGQAAADFARPRNHPDHVAEETMAAYEFILRNERVKR